MHWSLFVLAGLGLVLAHGLKLPFAGPRAASITAFLAGLLVTAFTVKAIAGVAGIGRTTDFDRFVKAAVIEATQDDAPLIVFTGASYSRNGIDPERLTLALRERGYPHRVINLSIEAASVLERDAHLNQFIKQSGRVPDIVFVEVARDFDHRAAYMFGNSKFNMRAIEQFDVSGAVWTSFGILGGACNGAKGCVLDTAYVGLHTAMNMLNVGLIGSGETATEIEALPAYDPQVEARAKSQPRLALQQDTVSVFQGPQWVRSFRYQQQGRLTDMGVGAIGYYQPPTLDPAARAYLDGLCAGEFIQHACISPNDPQLMQQLNGEHWFDPSHLLDSGTAIYNRWLVEELIASQVLEHVS